MGKKSTGMEGKGNQGIPQNHLRREQEFIDKVLSAFDLEDVNAMVIMEKYDKQISVMTNGISGNALIAFLVDLFIKEPKLHQAVVKIIGEMNFTNGKGNSNVMIH